MYSNTHLHIQTIVALRGKICGDIFKLSQIAKAVLYPLKKEIEYLNKKFEKDILCICIFAHLRSHMYSILKFHKLNTLALVTDNKTNYSKYSEKNDM